MGIANSKLFSYYIITNSPKSENKAFPSRLEWQPIFYPVLNQEYAEQIAEKCNTKDEFAGYCGVVTKFDLPTNYLQKYEVHNVGGFLHNELWVPSEGLAKFNTHIIGQIEIVKVFTGENFVASAKDVATQCILKYLDR